MNQSTFGVERLNVEQAVQERYSSAARSSEPELCCPTHYDAKYLDILPQELVERDYGCGDPTCYVDRGDAVLDLGCGGGKVCYIASQIVGPDGRVVGIDMNKEMLALAHKYRQEVGDRLGYHNVEFYRGRIQDLELDLELFDTYLRENHVTQADDWLRALSASELMRQERPMVATESIDVVISNCVLNLVDPPARNMMFDQIHRVLLRGGRAVISDIVCDEPVPQHVRNDPKLWSGCISGAFVEPELFDAFHRAGFYGMEILHRQEEPWATIEGIEFRSITIRAFKGKEGPRMDHNQAVIYKGPWSSVRDDDGHTLRRGLRTAVCQKTFQIYSQAPYSDQIISVSPYQAVSPEEAVPYDCRDAGTRHPRDTKGQSFGRTQLPADNCCGPGECC